MNRTQESVLLTRSRSRSRESSCHILETSHVAITKMQLLFHNYYFKKQMERNYRVCQGERMEGDYRTLLMSSERTGNQWQHWDDTGASEGTQMDLHVLSKQSIQINNLESNWRMCQTLGVWRLWDASVKMTTGVWLWKKTWQNHRRWLTSGMGQGHTLRQQTWILAGYLASKHCGMWSEGKFKSGDSALLGTISRELHDVVTGVLFSNSSLSSHPDCHH